VAALMWLEVSENDQPETKEKLWQHKANDSKKCGLVVKASEVRKRTTQSTRQAMYVERNIVARSRNHCRSGKAISTKHYECVCVCVCVCVFLP
jgi:hypothetical protein